MESVVSLKLRKMISRWMISSGWLFREPWLYDILVTRGKPAQSPGRGYITGDFFNSSDNLWAVYNCILKPPRRGASSLKSNQLLTWNTKRPVTPRWKVNIHLRRPAVLASSRAGNTPVSFPMNKRLKIWDSCILAPSLHKKTAREVWKRRE